MSAIATDLAYYFLLLIIYSCAGWVYESTLCSILAQKLVNRGFLTGPLCPIYGCGALLVIVTLSDIKDNLPALFMSAAVLTTTLEYLTAVVLEKCFSLKLWDYSEHRFNLNGRICLEGFLVFGLMSVLTIHFIQPLLNSWIGRLNPAIFFWLGGCIFGVFIVDFCFTVQNLLGINQRMAALEAELNTVLAESVAKAQQRKIALAEKLSEAQQHKLTLGERHVRRLLNAFPNMKSTRYGALFDKFKLHFASKANPGTPPENKNLPQ